MNARGKQGFKNYLNQYKNAPVEKDTCPKCGSEMTFDSDDLDNTSRIFSWKCSNLRCDYVVLKTKDKQYGR